MMMTHFAPVQALAEALTEQNRFLSDLLRFCSDERAMLPLIFHLAYAAIQPR